MKISFIGREMILRRLKDLTLDHSVLLEGARGVGKTEVLKELEASAGPDRLVLRFDLQGVSSADELVVRMAKHADLARGRIEEFVGSLWGGWRTGDPWESLASLLSHRAGGSVVLFDEVAVYLDAVAGKDRAQAQRDLAALDRLRASHAARFVLTGSIRLGPVAAQLGAPLSPDWTAVRLEPLEPASGCTLFQHHVDGVCGDPAAGHGHALAGGNPRWIKLLAQNVVCPPEREATTDDVEAAVDRVLRGAPFSAEQAHLRRHPDAARLQRALELAALANATQVSVRTALQAEGASRAQAVDAIEALKASFALSDAGTHTLPLYARWLQKLAG